MEMIIQEGANGMIFEDVTNWEIKHNKITGTFNVEVYRDEKIVGHLPYNVKTTVLMFNYEGHFDDEPFSTNGKRA